MTSICRTISRLPRRSVLAGLGIAAAVVMAGTALVLTVADRSADASHRFNDVATGSWIHANTAWLVDHDIANGFDDGSFRPNDGISRAQVAFWLGNYNATITRHQSTKNSPAGPNHSHEAFCPDGKRAISGGGLTSNATLHMYASFPKAGGTSWQVSWRTDDAASVSASVTVHVICVPQDP